MEFDATLTFSAAEKLKEVDFEQMSTAELAPGAAGDRAAGAAGQANRQPPHPRRPGPAGLADWRGTMRAALRSGGEVQALVQAGAAHALAEPCRALRHLGVDVVRFRVMLLHFLHAAANARGAGWAQVHAFTFGTRLTNITRHLRQPRRRRGAGGGGARGALWRAAPASGQCLHAFNRDWSRRVLSQGAVVLLITDGLDRDDPDRLALGDGAAAALGAPSDLAKPALALGRLHPARPRHPGDPAARRQPSEAATTSPR